ncbi:MAG: hypothetical protein ETSY2_35085 [Candidatus Entotheonella gemina]|uniref:Uncharacterized protein n=2 Tax=Candidatus Entotheonella TaxID=93171 RepID=W4LXP1_9BACT|nr:MAG: hypothetical protein ETSY2_35085 [Candidatus Entotheonella gemina]
MSGQDELERYEQTEARDLIRLLAMSRPQEELRAPPDFRLKVLSKIHQTPSRRGILSWLSVDFVPTWAPALTAALLVLSLGVNVWLGARALDPAEVQTVRAPAPAYAFQKGIRQEADLGALVAVQKTETGLTSYGFADKSAGQQSFLLGTLYAEALAYARSGDLEAATQRWQTMDQALGQTAEPLISYRRNMQGWLQQKPPALEQFQAVLPWFEPAFETYAAGQHDQVLPLFQAGAWMTNMRLAAEAGEVDGLIHGRAVDYFLARLKAPKGVEEGFRRLDDLMAKKTLSEREIKIVIKTVKKMQRILG